MAMISVNNISKTFGRIKALNSISFQINKGEVVGLLGPNGAGKTTTMKILTSFLPPDSGEVLINSQNIFSYPKQAKQMIGYLPEGTPLYSNMRVEEFLLYCAHLKGLRKNAKKAVIRSLESCHLEDMRKRIIGNLSKGYRQRVGLAQALINDPPILILDEPTVGLDPNQVVKVRNLIKSLKKDRTIIISTHILPEVEAVCEKVIIIHNGNIIKESYLKDLTSSVEGTTKITLEIKGNTDGFISACKKNENISSIGKNDDESIIIETRSSKERKVREELFRTAVLTDSVLLEIRKDKVTLETIFLELIKEI
ncbi:MAG: ATP-binding cassette domain-containing protein [Candidatus Aureabacteria bacterium]|nr:ATP-binding cassette domain-containing protein [Candidatus Auribacterota bacterium]